VNCYDCAVTGAHRDAAAICADCGAATCIEHAVNAQHWLTHTALINRVERIDPPARMIRCGTCHAAHAARGDVTAVTAPSHLSDQLTPQQTRKHAHSTFTKPRWA
jgi:hypothetical protein